MSELLVGNGTVLTLGDRNRVIPHAAVAIRDGLIVEVNDVAALVGRYAGARYIDAHGGLIMPGFINAHTHFYGAFARGMPFQGPPPANFKEILERVWWRLDRGLLAPDVRYSALLGLLDCVRKGTTTIFDHHASPHCVEGSLDLIAEATTLAGVRACLCYEVSDRDGRAIAGQGVTENRRFLERCRSLPSPLQSMLRAAFGLHASFTVHDDTLAASAAVCDSFHAPVHVHVAEADVDVETSVRAYGARPVARLHRAGLLDRPALLAHCVHLDEEEHALLAERGSWVLHNPQSNMNNAVGTAPLPRLLASGVRVALGSDGMTADMTAEMRALCFAQRAATQDPRTLDLGQMYDILFRQNASLVEQTFNVKTGVLEPGAAGDVIVVDYDPPTPLTDDNFLGHLFFGVSGAPVRSTIVAGSPLMENGRLLTLDASEIHAKARELAPRAWKRMD